MSKNFTILDLVKKRTVLLDGAMGSLLIAAGLPPKIAPESWNVSQPKVIQKIHKDYFLAGSDIVLTNTFGGTRIKLDNYSLGEKVELFNEKAVENARVICPGRKFIAGDIGPTGKYLPPVGKATYDDFFNNFHEQAKILTKSDVDFFFIETMVDLQEADAALKATKKASNKPIFVSMTYQKTKRGFFTIMGNSIEQCVELLAKNGAQAIGANCTLGSDEMIELAKQLRKITTLPIIIKPNAGKPIIKNDQTYYPITANDFAQDMKQIIEAQANIVGGCCGTTPEYIKEIYAILGGKME